MVPGAVSSRLALGRSPRRLLGQRAPFRTLYFLPERDRPVGTRRDLWFPRRARAGFRPVKNGRFDPAAVGVHFSARTRRAGFLFAQIALARHREPAYIGRP